MHRYHQVHNIVFVESFQNIFFQQGSIGIDSDEHSFLFQVVNKVPKKRCYKWFSSRKYYISGPSLMEFIYNLLIVIKSESFPCISPFEWVVIVVETVVTKEVTFTGNSKYHSKWYFVIKFFVFEKMEVCRISFCKYLCEFNNEILVISSYIPVFSKPLLNPPLVRGGSRTKVYMFKIYVGFIIFIT